MIDEAVAALACPVCRGGLSAVPAGLRCAAGHAFDRARQGYVHLSATPIRHPGDSAAMVAARDRVQRAGVFDALTATLAEAIPPGAVAEPVPVVIDLGAGTGHHLAGVLAALGDPVGIAIDTSKPALRRTARAHPRVLAIAADVTQRLPLQDGSVDVALITFAPRAADELARVVRPGGVVVVATPLPGHLVEIAEVLEMLEVPADKATEVAEALGASFVEVEARVVDEVVAIDRAMAVDLALMGPAGFHADEAAFRDRATTLPDAVDVHIALTVQVFRG